MKAYKTKVCPRCGEVLFADMHVCYGCLYEFPAEQDGAATRDSEKPVEGETGAASQYAELPELREDEPFLWDAGLSPMESAPRWEDDTLDLSVADSPTDAGTGGPRDAGVETSPPPSEILCWVRTPSADVRLPIPEKGLVLGRDSTSDVVLHSRAVSRSHVRILPAGGGEKGMRVVDLGATNPATFSGREVRGEVLVPLGWTVSVCGTFVTAVQAEL